MARMNILAMMDKALKNLIVTSTESIPLAAEEREKKCTYHFHSCTNILR
jgi:hypothetical protein